MSYGGLCEDQAGFPGPLDSIVERGSSSAQAAGVALTADESVNLATVTLLPPIAALDDIIFAEFNYLDPALESSMAAPEAPMRFAWIPPSSMGRGVAMVRPPESEEFDCEGALAAVIGLVRRRIAMDHTTGYSIINDGFVRAYQRFTSQ